MASMPNAAPVEMEQNWHVIGAECLAAELCVSIAFFLCFSLVLMSLQPAAIPPACTGDAVGALLFNDCKEAPPPKGHIHLMEQINLWQTLLHLFIPFPRLLESDFKLSLFHCLYLFSLSDISSCTYILQTSII